MTASPSARADVFLVEHGYAQTRAEAQEAIAAGCVSSGGKLVTKPSQRLNESAHIKYSRAHPFVSRGALKLSAALDTFELSPRDRICLDIGASTGGFSQVLLLRGARRVYAVDVGHGQLAPKIAADHRVVVLEGTNARDLTEAAISCRPQAVVADVSFISLTLVLPNALALADRGAWLVALVKPQFEVGRAHVGKGGIVKDAQRQRDAVDRIGQWIAKEQGWSVLGTMESPVKGGDGNREFLIAARKP
ncbi:MAG: TlyA family RNA methyltransferase [Alphaproteobacteria bacterium]|nr:TlyA family RNA methyltransferase [Alphaproteobacteria bacterium]MBV9694447.1 TlyA family RNA methyltransferase [Alphaproteobacteria bacterium]